MKQCEPTVVSLFTGAGGMDYGFEAAGFRTVACVEMDRDACATIRLNRPRWSLLESDVASVSGADLLKAAGNVGDGIDVLIGGPPCQPFSAAAYWRSRGDSPRLQDPRANTLGHFIRLVGELLPTAIVMENVPAFAFRGKRDGLDLVERGLREVNARQGTNYQPCAAILCATDYGVPQDRRRFFLVASKEGTPFAFPKAEPEVSRNAWDAIGNLRPEPGEDLSPGGSWGDLLPSIPEGANYLHHTRKGPKSLFGWRTRYWSFLLKLAKNLPAWTIPAQPGSAAGPFHWDNRRLSRAELARLQTFPDKVLVCGGRTAIQRQIGNAVPSLLAEVVARAVRMQLVDGHRYRSQPKLLLPKRCDCPERATPGPVPQKYWNLQREYPDHPGTAKGPNGRTTTQDAAE